MRKFGLRPGLQPRRQSQGRVVISVVCRENWLQLQGQATCFGCETPQTVIDENFSVRQLCDHVFSKYMTLAWSSRQAMASRLRGRKRPCTRDAAEASPAKCGKSSKVLMNPNVMGDHMLPLLPPRTLLAAAICSREVMARLSHETVVRSVLISGGGHGKTTLRSILALVCGQKAFPDSWPPFRETSQGRIWIPSPLRLLRLCLGRTCEMPRCSGKVNHIRPEWGLFACWPCTLNSTLEVTSAQQWSCYGPALKHPRTCRADRKFLWKQSLVKGNERVGPIVTVDGLQSQSLGDILAETSAAAAAADAPEAQKLLEAFLPAAARARQLEEAAADLKRDRKGTKAAKFAEVRDDIASRLSTMPWKDIAMSAEEVSKIIQPFQKAPSSYFKTKKKASVVEQEIRQLFSGVDQSVLDLRFCDDSIFGQALRAEAEAMGPTLFTKAPRSFFDLLSRSLKSEALLQRCSVEKVFAQAVAAQLPAMQHSDSALAEDFAVEYFRRAKTPEPAETVTSRCTELKRLFPEMLEGYKRIRDAAMHYCEWAAAQGTAAPSPAVCGTIFTSTSGGRGRGIIVPPTRPGTYLAHLEDGSVEAFRRIAKQQLEVNDNERTACLDEDCQLLSPSGLVRAGDLRAGDAVHTGTGPAKIVCVTWGRERGDMCKISGVWLTPKHPVRTGVAWFLPQDVARRETHGCGVVNFVLEHGHSVMVRAGQIILEAVTLGHQQRDAAAAVPEGRFGSKAYVDFLTRQPDFPHVFLPKKSDARPQPGCPREDNF